MNQAVRRRPQDAKALVQAGAELRKAQRGAISGRDPAALREATRTHRSHVEELTEAAREALEPRGAVAPAVLTRVAQTLRSASVDKEASKALLAGRLADDVEQSGFGPLLSAVPSRARSRAAAKSPKPAKPKPKPPPKPKPDPNAARRAKLERELERARERVRELEGRLSQLA